MTIVRSPRALQRLTTRLRRAGKRIGFVPTMGALHEGHLALIRRARRDSDVVIVSLFVNPLQFDRPDDLARYPRPFARDAALARSAGADLLFAPSAAALYPPDFQTGVEVSRLARRWEGAQRPGHFRGVATVVTTLFHLAQPTTAYVGEKDAQQARIVQQLVRDLRFPIRIVIVPVVREADGLAMSSRNRRLSSTERRAALVVFAALQAARRLIKSGPRRRETVLRRMRAVVRRAPRVRLEYAAVVDPRTLEPVAVIRGPVRLLIAVRAGRVRLIDTLGVRPREAGHAA